MDSKSVCSYGSICDVTGVGTSSGLVTYYVFNNGSIHLVPQVACTMYSTFDLLTGSSQYTKRDTLLA